MLIEEQISVSQENKILVAALWRVLAARTWSEVITKVIAARRRHEASKATRRLDTSAHACGR